MSQLDEKHIFIVLYNYSDCDYSIIKIAKKLDDAYKCICQQESKYFNKPDSFKMINIFEPEDIAVNSVSESLNICYIQTEQYNKFNLCEYYNVSQYAIVNYIVE